MYNVENLKSFPENCGCYIMKDVTGKIIYIGKAKNIKKRVNQYFNGQDKRQKIDNLRKNIDSIEYIVTTNELEALVLENNLIKESKPYYNTLLKDDRQYPFIKITNEEYPKLILTKKFLSDKAYYYGPFTDSNKVKEIINILQKEYKLVLCDKFDKNSCLYYQINKCSAPCIEKIDKESYNKNVEECKEVLNGKISKIIKKLTTQMMEKSNDLDFENAAKIRDEIEAIKYITNKQFVQLKSDESEDIIVNRENVVVLFKIKNGKLLLKQHFFMTDNDDIVEEFIKQFYSSIASIPNVLFLEKSIENIEILEQFLTNIKGKAVTIKVPEKGSKKKILNLAIQNAEVIINEQKRKKELNKEKQILGIKHLEKLLGFELNRIESFDISNTSGVLNVASMVVFENGKPQYKKYRKFKLSVNGPNDYECMKEVIRRRFTDEELLKTLPDVIFVDGGKGQISAIQEIFDILKIDIPVCGMLKDDSHNTKALIFDNKELDIKTSSPEFKLITNIQDETHNFAINYHKKLRDKNMIKSILDNIKGLGEVRKKLLLQKFGSIENIKESSIEELTEIKGINKEIATEILNVLNNTF